MRECILSDSPASGNYTLSFRSISVLPPLLLEQATAQEPASAPVPPRERARAQAPEQPSSSSHSTGPLAQCQSVSAGLYRAEMLVSQRAALTEAAHQSKRQATCRDLRERGQRRE